MILSVAILARAIWTQVDHSILDQAHEISGDCLPCMACRSHWQWQWPTMTRQGQQQDMAQSIGPLSTRPNKGSLIVFQCLRTPCLSVGGWVGMLVGAQVGGWLVGWLVLGGVWWVGWVGGCRYDDLVSAPGSMLSHKPPTENYHFINILMLKLNFCILR